jgi:hypothetical protein
MQRPRVTSQEAGFRQRARSRFGIRSGGPAGGARCAARPSASHPRRPALRLTGRLNPRSPLVARCCHDVATDDRDPSASAHGQGTGLAPPPVSPDTDVFPIPPAAHRWISRLGPSTSGETVSSPEQSVCKICCLDRGIRTRECLPNRSKHAYVATAFFSSLNRKGRT